VCFLNASQKPFVFHPRHASRDACQSHVGLCFAMQGSAVK
jgi:hypothetical protein